MCLNVYRDRSSVPSGMQIVDVNDSYFNAYTKLDDSPLEREILQEIDEAEYGSSVTFVGRDKKLGKLNKSFLSTGTKTIINILDNPDVCFNVCECGDNVLKFLPRINNGNVLWKRPFLVVEQNIPCNIQIEGKSFNDLCSFLQYCYYEE